jgi:hypothetical protein
MHDQPSAGALIAAVRQHLETAVLPTIEDQRLRFQTLVAAHVLSVVERELALGDEQLQAEWQRLDALLHNRQPLPATSAERQAALDARNRRLCELIRAGTFDANLEQEMLQQHLQQSAIAKLAVANPKFLARVQREARP